MLKMRLVSEAYNEIKAADPDTAISRTGFRRLVNEGKIPCVNVGNKRLVSMEAVYAFFEKGEPLQEPESGKIRRIPV